MKKVSLSIHSAPPAAPAGCLAEAAAAVAFFLTLGGGIWLLFALSLP